VRSVHAYVEVDDDQTYQNLSQIQWGVVHDSQRVTHLVHDDGEYVKNPDILLFVTLQA